MFDRGVHEFSEVRLRGSLSSPPESGDLGALLARLRHVARREDVWLPDPEQLHEAYAELSMGVAQLNAHRARQAEASVGSAV